MKKTSFRLAAIALVVLALSFIEPGRASAATYVSVQVGRPPPPPPAYIPPPWARPYRTAVWIPPGYAWNGNRYVWIGGYWAYPPRPGAYWAPAHYRHGAFYPGRWRY